MHFIYSDFPASCEDVCFPITQCIMKAAQFQLIIYVHNWEAFEPSLSEPADCGVALDLLCRLNLDFTVLIKTFKFKNAILEIA